MVVICVQMEHISWLMIKHVMQIVQQHITKMKIQDFVRNVMLVVRNVMVVLLRIVLNVLVLVRRSICCWRCVFLVVPEVFILMMLLGLVRSVLFSSIVLLVSISLQRLSVWHVSMGTTYRLTRHAWHSVISTCIRIGGTIVVMIVVGIVGIVRHLMLLPVHLAAHPSTTWQTYQEGIAWMCALLSGTWHQGLIVWSAMIVVRVVLVLVLLIA